MKDVLIILCCVILNVLGQMSFKQGMQKIGKISSRWNELVPAMARTLVNPYILLGLALYGMGILIWFFIISRVKLSFAYPMISTSYIFVVFFSWLIFKEEVPLTRLIGVLIVLFGVILIAKGTH